jgi:hypothetical protein
MAEEVQLNNSFKPTPLRGTAYFGRSASPKHRDLEDGRDMLTIGGEGC